MTGYSEAALVLRRLGWTGVLPLARGTKFPPPSGYTGKDGAYPSAEDYARWDAAYPDGNICLRLPDGVVGIDVDAYDGKTGEATLEEGDKRWGLRPPTYRATSRGDGVSGIRLYRMPTGTKLRGALKFPEMSIGDVDIIQCGHRYMVVWPSVHPKGGTYRWIEEASGQYMDGPPSPDELPELPAAWIEGLRETHAHNGSETGRTARTTNPNGQRSTLNVTAAMTPGLPSPRVAERLGRAIGELAQGHNRHDTIRDHVLGLLRFGRNGEGGVDLALTALYRAFTETVGPDRDGGESSAMREFERMCANAEGLLAAEPPHLSAHRRQTGGHLRDRLLSLSGLAHLPPVTPLIDGLLYRDTLGQLAGPPGCYKSFAAIGMACAVAAGVPFAGFNVPEAGRVVFVAAEGASGLRARVLAWCEEEGVDPEALDGRLLILPEPVQLGTAADVAQAVDVVGEFDAALVVFDTRARCTVGLEENSATEQGKAIDAVEQIRAAVGCTVLAVHHSARTGTTGRGSSAWDGAVWSDLRMGGEGLAAKITCAKHKEVPDGCEHHLVLRPHTVPRELMPDTLLEDQRRTLAISRNALGILSVRANSKNVVLEIVRNSAPPEGFTAKQVADQAASAHVSQSSVYAALKALVDEGVLLNVGTQARSRYVAKAGQ